MMILQECHGRRAYDQFITAVAEGRKMSIEDVKRLADGRIFSGRQALKMRLVDELGDLEHAIASAAKMVGIEGEASRSSGKRKVPDSRNAERKDHRRHRQSQLPRVK
ncbi:MAG: S49 family peptidase [Desulfobacterales bacterium]|nr:S49 family peptidase [Desulfobacterales bacterium]